jgi:hypothetical protein
LAFANPPIAQPSAFIIGDGGDTSLFLLGGTFPQAVTEIRGQLG